MSFPRSASGQPSCSQQARSKCILRHLSRCKRACTRRQRACTRRQRACGSRPRTQPESRERGMRRRARIGWLRNAAAAAEKLVATPGVCKAHLGKGTARVHWRGGLLVVLHAAGCRYCARCDDMAAAVRAGYCRRSRLVGCPLSSRASRLPAGAPASASNSIKERGEPMPQLATNRARCRLPRAVASSRGSSRVLGAALDCDRNR